MDVSTFPGEISHLTPLSPLAFLERSSAVYGDRLAVVDDDWSWTYQELLERSMRLAGLLASLGISSGDRVAVLSPNTHVLLEAHYGVPASGAVLVPLNTRLAVQELSYILDHAGVSVLMADRTLLTSANEAVRHAGYGIRVIEIGRDDSEVERLLASAEPTWAQPRDETQPLSINYTSGTTGRPKGVIYHHRGAYLQSIAMAYHARLDLSSVYLWTLPMFHTNGWCFPWAVTAAGAVHRCLRKIDPLEIWQIIHDESVTHLCAAPTVLIMLADSPAAAADDASARRVQVMTGGAPPTPSLIKRLGELNMEVIHLYGLTETFGPAAICDWRPEWDELPMDEQADLKARQGVGNIISARVRVVTDEGVDVPPDGTTIGEIAITGNNLMAGYFRDPESTRRVIPDGWFRTGDLAVMHPNGYIEIRDRKKDIIISGGENISSVEIERVLATHPAVYEAAVIARPDEKWGEVPVAVVELRPSMSATASDLIEHCRGQVAAFKIPREIVFMELPRTSTGKIQKHEIRAVVARDN